MNMSVENVLNLIGFGFLIMSWTLPRLSKNVSNRSFIGAVLSAVSIGFFTSALVVTCMS